MVSDFTEEIYYDKQNREIKIMKPNDPNRVKGGKEGSIYEIISYKNIKYNVNNLIFKCFDRSTDPYEKYDKISDMIRKSQSSDCIKYFNAISDNVAFPLETVYKDMNRKNFAGFIMRKVSTETNFKEFTRNSNHTYFNFSTCVNVATQLCKIVFNIHQMGYVIGDFNDLNILLDKNDQVFLVDADSFIFDKYGIEIGRPEMLPKEIIEYQRKMKQENLDTISYNKNTDNYALAVHLYKLFTGSYPYIHKNINYDKSDDSSIAYAVLNGKYPLTNPLCQLPNHFFPLRTIPRELTTLMYKAFSQKYRPGAEQYLAALNKLRNKSKKCQRSEKHIFYKDLGKCPCCEYSQANDILYKFDDFNVLPKKESKKAKTIKASHTKSEKLKAIGWTIRVALVLLPILVFLISMVSIGVKETMYKIYLFDELNIYYMLIYAGAGLIALAFLVAFMLLFTEYHSIKEKITAGVMLVIAYFVTAFFVATAFTRPTISSVDCLNSVDDDSLVYVLDEGQAQIELNIDGVLSYNMLKKDLDFTYSAAVFDSVELIENENDKADGKYLIVIEMNPGYPSGHIVVTSKKSKKTLAEITINSN